MKEVFSKIICFIACHGAGPADHFAAFTEVLQERGYEVHLYASGAALKRLQEKQLPNVTAFEVDGLSEEEEDALAEQITEKCEGAQVVITDMAHQFDEKVLKSLTRRKIKTIGYYDNPEPYVPGGYSLMVAKTAQYASKVLFANKHLAYEPLYQTPQEELCLPLVQRIGLGYYPVIQAKRLLNQRSLEDARSRRAFFQKHGLIDKGQKIFVYFGGNNTEYFHKAFPVFVTCLQKTKELFSDMLFVIHQHPAAKIKNIDKGFAEKELPSSVYPYVVFSKSSTEDLQQIADGALYYQTSMGPLFALAGIPRMQIAHEIYSDLLVREQLCFIATDPISFSAGIDKMQKQKKTLSKIEEEAIMESLGIADSWEKTLEESL